VLLVIVKNILKKKFHGQNTGGRGECGLVVRVRTEINTHTVLEEESASDRRITLDWILRNSWDFRLLLQSR
jgi:hypothetical protein